MTATADAPVASQAAVEPQPGAAAEAAAPKALVVGSVVGQQGTVVCLGEATLADAADLLVLHNRTAGGVVDAAGAVLGAVTENDILQAYCTGVPALSTVSAWLQGGHARLPAALLPALTVQPTTSLLDAAARMRAQAGTDSAFRHLVVRKDDGAFVGILSALDLSRALCGAGSDAELVQRVGKEVVSEIMKPRGTLPVCSNSATLGHVLETMTAARQNCILVTDGEEPAHPILGVVTPRDAMRAFADHVPLDTSVGHWLRGLQSKLEPRMVSAGAPLLEAAALMAGHSMHHLVVVCGTTASSVVGVLSSSDLAQSLGSAEHPAEGRAPNGGEAPKAAGEQPQEPRAAEGAAAAPKLLVGSVVGQRGTVAILGETTLADAADLLILNDHTAGGVVDAAGAMLGAITENDIVQAYSTGVSALSSVNAWLQSGHARLPGAMLPALTVQPSTSLLDAAARMRAQAGTESAFRHLVVKDDDGALVSILSALDLARALCTVGSQHDAMQRLGSEVVSEVMKHRAMLAVCSSSTTLGHALDKMTAARQNCVLIADGEEATLKLLGVVTPRDAMRAFAEHVPLETNVGHWLRGVQSKWEPRVVKADAPIFEAAALMASHCLHHLLVVSAATSEVVGVVSSSDLAQSLGSAERFVEGCNPCGDEGEAEAKRRRVASAGEAPGSDLAKSPV